MKSIEEWCKEISEWRKEKGFITEWENVPTKLMLVVTELSEAMEAYRDRNRSEFAYELADATIRIFDLAGTLGVDLEHIIMKKMDVNRERPPIHGRKFNDREFINT